VECLNNSHLLLVDGKQREEQTDEDCFSIFNCLLGRGSYS
jgi:hypothetical protein